MICCCLQCENVATVYCLFFFYPRAAWSRVSAPSLEGQSEGVNFGSCLRFSHSLILIFFFLNLPCTCEYKKMWCEQAETSSSSCQNNCKKNPKTCVRLGQSNKLGAKSQVPLAQRKYHLLNIICI